MSVDSTCRLHASRTLNLLPCLSSHCIGEPGKLHTKTGCIIRYQQSDILQAVNTSVPAALWLLYVLITTLYIMHYTWCVFIKHCLYINIYIWLYC